MNQMCRVDPQLPLVSTLLGEGRDDVVEQLASEAADTARVLRFGNPLRSPLTVERMLIQAGQADAGPMGVEAAEGALLDLCRAEGDARAVVVVVEQADTLSTRAVAALARVLDRERANGLRLVLAGEAALDGVLGAPEARAIRAAMAGPVEPAQYVVMAAAEAGREALPLRAGWDAAPPSVLAEASGLARGGAAGAPDVFEVCDASVEAFLGALQPRGAAPGGTAAGAGAARVRRLPRVVAGRRARASGAAGLKRLAGGLRGLIEGGCGVRVKACACWLVGLELVRVEVSAPQSENPVASTDVRVDGYLLSLREAWRPGNPRDGLASGLPRRGRLAKTE